MPWLSLTLEVEAASAELLSEALLETGALSVSIDNPEAPSCRVNALIDVAADAAGLLSAAAARAGLAPVPRFHAARIEDEDWVRRSQAQFSAIPISERLWVGAAWHQPPARFAGAVVRLDPGLAFGTGSHPSTQLVLRFLERAVRGGERVLDYGCGSGILAVAAAKLGASEVDAVDIDPQSVTTTAENAARNGVTVRAAAPEALADAVYDVIVANILAQPLILLAPLLAARAAAGARLALSGILDGQAAEVVAAYSPYFDIAVSDSSEGWALVEGARR